MSTSLVPNFSPAVPFLVINESEQPYLEGSRCEACGAVMPGVRQSCVGCGREDQLSTIKLGEQGVLKHWTIVYRSFPGVTTPFISVVVKLESGAVIKGSLLERAPDPEQLPKGLPLKLVFRDSGQKTEAGEPFLAYYFVPLEA